MTNGGDTITSIAQMLGVSVAALVLRNSIKLRGRNVREGLPPGINLRLPMAGGARSDVQAKRLVVQTKVTLIGCSVCKTQQRGDEGTACCCNCGADFGERGAHYEMMAGGSTKRGGEGHNTTRVESSAAGGHKRERGEAMQKAVATADRRVDKQRTQGFVKARDREGKLLDNWARALGADYRTLLPSEVVAYLNESSQTRGRTILHGPNCRSRGSAKMNKTCTSACVRSSAAESMRSRATLVAAVYTGIGRVGPFMAGTPTNNPVQSSLVRMFLQRFRQECAVAGAISEPRPIVSTGTVTSILTEAYRRVRLGIQAIETKKAARTRAWVGKGNRAMPAKYYTALWAQMGAIIALAFAKSQRAQSIANVRADSAALVEQGKASVLLVNAILSKMRRDGSMAWMAARQLPSRSSIICPVRWYKRMIEAYKVFFAVEDMSEVFEPSDSIFCKIWRDSGTGEQVHRVQPSTKPDTSMWSTRLTDLMRGAGIEAVPGLGISALRGGGAVAMILSQKKSVREVMEDAEWKTIKTFARYTQLFAVLGGETTDSTRRFEGKSPWAMLEESDYLMENTAAQRAEAFRRPYKKSNTGK